MTAFIYPWINIGGYCEQELKMSLRSLEAHVVGNYRVFVVGDCPPRLADLVYIKHERNLVGPHIKCVDAVQKLQRVIDTPQVPDQFVYMADDIALLRPFEASDVAMPIGLCEVDEHYRMDTINDALMMRTVQALRAAGHTRVWNYETHMPRLFSKRRLQEIFAKYDPAKNHLMIPTLYFNHFWKDQKPVLLSKMDNRLARFAGKENANSFGLPLPSGQGSTKAYHLRCMHGKAFANWNDAGLCQGLVDALREHLPTKSTHETSTRAYTT